MNDEIEVDREIDEICNVYETLWFNGQKPDFGSMLSRVKASSKASLLRALIDVDIELRQKSDSPLNVEAYQKRLEKLSEYNVEIEKFIESRLARLENIETRYTGDEKTHPTSRPAGKDEIAGFKLLKQIGQGGMGTVWKAEQYSPIRRLVALKVVRAELSARDVIARFEAERQALALMNHPNIARILDGGINENKQPWFAMELVDGQPVIEYCDRNNFSIKERLELCIQICSAVQHAHQKGIIHRDLKPSNVLVTQIDGRPVVKVIDFGLAKALEHTSRLTDESLATEFGQVLGTLKYMSPEQASVGQSKDVDTRTDVYSIGVILYQLLTGSTPLEPVAFKNKSLLEILKTIQNIDISKPSDCLKALPSGSLKEISKKRRLEPGQLLTILTGDLDWVVIKALAQDRGQRYQSASELAEDLKRHLNDAPVVARPPTIGYRAKKFIRRNRIAVIVAGLLLSSLTIGFIGTFWQMSRALSAEKTSESRRVDAVKAKNRADTNAEEAKRQSQLAFNTLFSVIGDIQNGLKNVPGGNSIRRVLLKRAIEKLESPTSSYINQATVARQSVVALNDLGDLALTLQESVKPSRSEDRESSVDPGVDELAKSFYQRALEIATELSQAEPEAADVQRLLATSNRRLGEFYLKTGQSKQAENHFDVQHRLANKLVESSPDDAENRQILANSFEQRGSLSLIKQNATQALEEYEAARDIRTELANEDPENTKNQRQLSRSLIRINEVMLQLGRIDDGLQQLEIAQQTLRQIIEIAPENSAYKRDLLVSLEREGDIFQALRRYEDANTSYDESLELAIDLLELEPGNLESMMTRSISHQKLGRLFLIQDRLPEALEQYKQSIQLDEAIIEINPLDVMANDGLAVSLGKRGEIKLRKNETLEALQDLQHSMKIRKKIADRDPDNLTIAKKLSVSYQRLGTYYVQTGKYDSALANHLESYKICKRLAELDPENDSAQRFLLSNYEHLAIVFDAMGEHEASVSELEKMVAIGQARASAHPDHPGVNHDYLYSCLRLAQAFQTTRELQHSCELCAEAVLHASTFLEKSPNGGIESMKGELENCSALARLRKQSLGKLDDFLKSYPSASEEFNLTDQPDFGLASLLEYRSSTQVDKQQFRLAAETAIKISEMDDANQTQLYRAARTLARCAAGLEASDLDDDSDTTKVDLFDDWINLSISTLQSAIRKGWDDFDQLQTDPSLEILRDKPGYKALQRQRDRGNPDLKK